MQGHTTLRFFPSSKTALKVIVTNNALLFLQLRLLEVELEVMLAALAPCSLGHSAVSIITLHMRFLPL